MTVLQADFEALQREVRALRDRQDIRDCIMDYCRGLDRLDADLLKSTYHANALDRHGPFFGTRDDFVPWAIEIEASVKATNHSVANHRCEIVGDTAHAETYCNYVVLLDDGETLIAGAARYVDQLERRDGKWAIVARCEVADFHWKLVRHDGGVWEEVRGKRDPSDLSYQRPLELPKPLP